MTLSEQLNAIREELSEKVSKHHKEKEDLKKESNV